jgi:hypothetical protein
MVYTTLQEHLTFIFLNGCFYNILPASNSGTCVGMTWGCWSFSIEIYYIQQYLIVSLGLLSHKEDLNHQHHHCENPRCHTHMLLFLVPIHLKMATVYKPHIFMQLQNLPQNLSYAPYKLNLVFVEGLHVIRLENIYVYVHSLFDPVNK